MKLSYNILSTLVFIILGYSALGQVFTDTTASNHSVEMELSIPHGNTSKYITDCSGFENDVFVIIRNNTDSTIRFYEDWNSFGYYNISFEIKTNDSIYKVTRAHNIRYRNFPSYHTVLPNESLVFPLVLIDSTCNSNRETRCNSAPGWVVIPLDADSVKIRAIYKLPEGVSEYPNHLRNYDEYLSSSTQSLPKKDTDTNIFSQPLFTRWHNVVIFK